MQAMRLHSQEITSLSGKSGLDAPNVQSASQSEAFTQGASWVLAKLRAFASNVGDSIPEKRSSEFERGQVDGVLWALDAIESLFEQE